jgi:hypothetical protein
MGAEELKKRRPSHDKYIDRQRVALATPDLFTRTPEDQPRTCVASIAHGETVENGESLVIEPTDSGMLGRRHNLVVLFFAQPPADILNAVRGGAGVATGEIIRINKLSRTVEVTIK